MRARFVDGAPAELPGELTVDCGECGRVAAVDEFECVGQFVERGFAAERQTEEAIDAADAVGGGVAVWGLAWARLQPLCAARGEERCLFDGERAVHQKQRLLRGGGLRPFGRVRVWVREIERAEKCRQVLALDETIDRAARGERCVGQ